MLPVETADTPQRKCEVEVLSSFLVIDLIV